MGQWLFLGDESLEEVTGRGRRQCFLSNASWGGLGSLKLQLAGFAKVPPRGIQE